MTVDECDGTEEEASGRGLFLLPLLRLPLLLLLLGPVLALLPSSGLFLASLIGLVLLMLVMLLASWPFGRYACFGFCTRHEGMTSPLSKAANSAHFYNNGRRRRSSSVVGRC